MKVSLGSANSLIWEEFLGTQVGGSSPQLLAPSPTSGVRDWGGGGGGAS